MRYDKEYIERRQSELHAKYNERIDTTIVVILLELEERTEAQRLILEEATKKINAAQKINHYNFTSNKQAFWFGFGKFGLAAIVLIISLFIFLVSYFPVLKNHEVANNLINHYSIKEDVNSGERTLLSNQPLEVKLIKTIKDVETLPLNTMYISTMDNKNYYTVVHLQNRKK